MSDKLQIEIRPIEVSKHVTAQELKENHVLQCERDDQRELLLECPRCQNVVPEYVYADMLFQNHDSLDPQMHETRCPKCKVTMQWHLKIEEFLLEIVIKEEERK